MTEPMPIETKKHETLPEEKHEKYIAIIGGGIAGLYTAWRLLQQNEELKKGEEGKEAKEAKKTRFVIHIYEKEEQVGGRISSEEIPGIPFRAELGAMRFRPSHKLLNALLAKFGIPTRSFDLPPPAFYIRGRRLLHNEITSGRCGGCHAESPFHLRESERGKSAEQLITHAINRTLDALNFPKLPQGKARQLKRRINQGFFDEKTWNQIKTHGTYQGLHLYEIGFWNLLQHFLSNEAYVMVHDVLSLESILGNWNAAEAIPWFLSEFASDQFDMVPGGLSRVANELEVEITPVKKEKQEGEGQNENTQGTKKGANEARCGKLHSIAKEADKGGAASSLGSPSPPQIKGRYEGPKEDIVIRRGYEVTCIDYVKRDGADVYSWTLHYEKLQRGDGDHKVSIRGFKMGYDSIILALPQSALVNLEVKKGGGHYERKNEEGKVVGKWPPQWIHWVKGHPMFKLFLLYEEPWWMGDNMPGHDNGRVFTDLPLRQIYYFSPTWMRKHGAFIKPKEEKEENKTEAGRQDGQIPQEAALKTKPVEPKTDKGGLSLIMASYSDEHYVSFWEPMLKATPESGITINCGPPYLHRTAKISDKDWQEITEKPSNVLAKRRMVDKVQLLLTEIHGREVPQPILGVVRDWEAGWHSWIVGSTPWDDTIRHERVNPLEGLYLCGEAYSTEHGWIEGALKSAEQVLEELGLTKPGWLTSILDEDFPDYIGCWKTEEESECEENSATGKQTQTT